LSHPARPAAKPVAELIGPALDPIVRKRGLARAEIISWWPDIVGAAYAEHTAPERIRWPRDGKAATLVVRCHPALALQFSYEADRVRERLNSYFGYPAVGAMRIVQQRVGGDEKRESAGVQEPSVPAGLEDRLSAIDGPLKAAILALGRNVLAKS
jgi:hypothetical protein